MPIDTGFIMAVVVASVLAGAIASVSGFGIGSVLTPLLTLRLGTSLAVAAVSIPHMVATSVRFWLLRKKVDRSLLLSFGLMSAAGGLTGALLHIFMQSKILTVVFGSLLVFTGILGITGLSERMRFRGWLGWLAGFVSGLLGGLVGNQGSIRSGALLGFDLPRDAFVATSTAVGVIVDVARVPIYLATQGSDIFQLWPLLVAAICGTVCGTFAGTRVLKKIPEPIYRRIVAAFVLILGLYMLFRGS